MDRVTDNWKPYGHIHFIQHPKHGICSIGPLAFTWGIFMGMSEMMYEGRYCYDNLTEAKAAFYDWIAAGGDGEPEGYIVRKGFGTDDKRGTNYET